MAKILISPIGLGGRFKNPDSHDREYQEACYKIGDKPYPASRFMASVLYKHFDLDGIIFIGTVSLCGRRYIGSSVKKIKLKRMMNIG